MKRDDEAAVLPQRRKSILAMVVPVSSLGALAVVCLQVGRRDDKLDNVVDTVKEIKAEMYRRSDAEVLNVKIVNLEHRVDALEAAHQHRVDVVTAKIERQEDDLLTRTQRWLLGNRPRRGS